MNPVETDPLAGVISGDLVKPAVGHGQLMQRDELNMGSSYLSVLHADLCE